MNTKIFILAIVALGLVSCKDKKGPQGAKEYEATWLRLTETDSGYVVLNYPNWWYDSEAIPAPISITVRGDSLISVWIPGAEGGYLLRDDVEERDGSYLFPQILINNNQYSDRPDYLFRWHDKEKHIAQWEIYDFEEKGSAFSADPTAKRGVRSSALYINSLHNPYPIVDFPGGTDKISRLKGVINALDKKITFTVRDMVFNMVLVEGGEFMMGCTDDECADGENPAKYKAIYDDYYIGETEVTQGLWCAVMGYKPTMHDKQWTSGWGLGHNYPVYGINYYDTQEFITRLNAITGQPFRLPTEAEWEYAARGGRYSKGYKYSGSNTIWEVAWYYQNRDGWIRPVGKKKPNELGIYDMSGNVWEWIGDWYREDPDSYTTPGGPVDYIDDCVLRGGWHGSEPHQCRVSYRYITKSPSVRSFEWGLRLVLEKEDAPMPQWAKKLRESYSASNVSYQNDLGDLGIGVVNPKDFAWHSFTLFNDVLGKEHIKIKTVFEGQDFVVPALNGPEYGQFNLVVKEVLNDYYKVYVNKETYGFVRKDEFTFYSWNDLLKNALFIGVETAYTDRDDPSTIVKFDHRTNLVLIEIDEDWIFARELDEAEFEGSEPLNDDELERLPKYWIKWREENKLLVTPIFMM